MQDLVALVVNPKAGRGRSGKELPRLLDQLDRAAVSYRVSSTQGPGHATELATEAAAGGAATVVAVGGDGTVNEVVNGLMTVEPGGRPSLGVVAAGSGADFARTFDLPADTGESLRGVIGATRPIDVGLIACNGSSGSRERYFVNIANIGIAAATVARAERLPRSLGGARYIVAFWPVLARYRPEPMTLTVDGAAATFTAHNLLVANGRYAGGGMHFSPDSEPGDGVFDVQLNIGPKRQAFTLIPKIYRGKHLPDERILQASGREITLAADTPQPVEADGELIGTSPVRISVVPGAVEMVVSA